MGKRRKDEHKAKPQGMPRPVYSVTAARKSATGDVQISAATICLDNMPILTLERHAPMTVDNLNTIAIRIVSLLNSVEGRTR